MKSLTGLDATFLYMETASQFGHVSGLSILAPPDERLSRCEMAERFSGDFSAASNSMTSRPFSSAGAR